MIWPLVYIHGQITLTQGKKQFTVLWFDFVQDSMLKSAIMETN
jgi:hypothetical protein